MNTTATKIAKQLPTQRGKGLSIALWILQALLAALFVMSGAMKFAMPAAQIAKQSPLPVPFIHFIGVCEVLGGIGLILPALLRILPVLTPVAAGCLVIIMIGATVVSLHLGIAAAAFPFLTGVLTAFVAWGRFRLRPIPPRP